MIKKLLLLVLPIFFGLNLFGQTGKIFGTLSDTVNYKPMAYSSISLIRKDSVLVRTQFSNQKSEFSLEQLPTDTYSLVITRPSYADYEETIVLKENEEKNLGTIVLISKENLLKEVLIKDRMAIRLRGDTTEFLVDSFLTNKNSNVEDLLKKLPGIQVDKNGKITAQGEEVKKVLVDGEEFFGSDPTVATRNLKAEKVETVQVFDKKSDETIKTGIDDGTKEKTINLTLKDDAKKGYFGKLGSGIGTKNDSKIEGVSTNYGTENRYEGEAMYNNFRNKRKVSVFSTISNTNKTGLNWEDREKYMGGNNVEYDEASGYMYSFFESDPNDYNGNGIPQTKYIGGFFGDKIKNDKIGFNITGTHKETNVQGADRNYTQYILPDTMYFNNQINKLNNFRAANNLSGKADFKLDSLSTLVIKANLTQTNFTNQNNFVSENFNGLSQIVNSNIRETNNKGQKISGNYSFNYNKKFDKKGRSFSLQFDHKFNQNESDGKLLSKTTYYNGDSNSTINSEQNLDQLKIMEEKGNNFGGRTTYTEPLSKTWSLIADYDYHLTLNHSLINTYNKNALGDYVNRVDTLSNDLEYNIAIQKGGITFRHITKKINASLGGRVSHTNLTLKNLIIDTTQYQNFLNFFPAAAVSYKINTTKNLRLSYNGSTRQPSLQQINPIQDLTNPLVIYKGNPELGQNFDNDVSLTYNSNKPIQGRGMYLSLNYSYTFNDFANFDEVDNQGRRIYKTVNVAGNQSIGGYMYYYFKIKSLNLNVNQSLNPSFSKNSNFINSLANTNTNTNFTYDISFNYGKEEKFDFNFSPNINYFRSITSLRPDVITQYFTYALNGSTSIYLPKRFEWFIDATYNIRQQTEVFSRNTNNLIVSAFISRKFLKDESLVAKIGVEDLLNQNIGFNRNASSNYINENTYIVLRRYFMFSLIYNFTNGAKD